MFVIVSSGREANERQKSETHPTKRYDEPKKLKK